ncbi:hypothetical protein B484DRAFT_414864, partial [Ochromonadaceae sp. CCMP2298]
MKAENVLPMYTESGMQCALPPKPAAHKVIQEARDAWRTLCRRDIRNPKKGQNGAENGGNGVENGGGMGSDGIGNGGGNGSGGGNGDGGNGDGEEEDLQMGGMSQESSASADHVDLGTVPSVEELELAVEIELLEQTQRLFTDANSPSSNDYFQDSLLSSGRRTRRHSGDLPFAPFDESTAPPRGVGAAGAAGAGGGVKRKSVGGRASQEELLAYRRDVEYVLPEDLSSADYTQCIKEGKFLTSRCPLPLPEMDESPRSPRGEAGGMGSGGSAGSGGAGEGGE